MSVRPIECEREIYIKRDRERDREGERERERETEREYDRETYKVREGGWQG